MKKLAFLLLALCIGGFYAHTSQSKSIGLSAKYNAATHTLSIQASNTPISALIAELEKQDFSLFIQDLTTDFQITGRYSAKPVDEVLQALIPDQYHFHYRISDEATERMLRQKSTANNSLQKKAQQSGSKTRAKKQNLPKLAAADALVSSVKFSDEIKATNKDLSLKQPPRFKSPASMKAPEQIKGNTQKGKSEAERRKASVSADDEGEHVVVTFRVTPSGMEAVATSIEKGKYIAAKQTITNDFVVTGNEAGKVVFLESVDNPLVGHSVTIHSHKDGSHQHHGHGEFKYDEGYVTVKMPKKYANASAARNLNIELAALQKDRADNLLQKFQQQKLRSVEVTRAATIISKAPTLDISKAQRQ
ncbi:MAG: hypothetical protein AAF738_07125 [Bacteroidota bacterium]